MIASGIDDIITITGRTKRSIEDHLTSYELEYTLQKVGEDREFKEIRKITDPTDICYVRQKDQWIRRYHKMWLKAYWRRPFAVILGDSINKGPTPFIKQLIEVYEKYIICNFT